MYNEQNFLDKPPYGNTGAENTEEIGLRACVDWLQATFKFVSDPRQICEFLFLDFNDFIHLDVGKYGYNEQIRYNNIAIYYNGREDMGCHLEMTGQGCRQYEALKKLEWSKLFAMMLDFADVNITRLDIAIDDFKPYFTVDQAIDKVKRGHIKSLFKTGKSIEKYLLKDGTSQGKTLYFGQPTSRIQIRIYDKKQERESKDQEVIVEHWVRTEIQARDERAKAIAEILAYTNYETGKVVAGILKNYINFLAENKKDSNKNRWKNVKWWNDFLGDVEKLKLTQVAPDYTIERANKWVSKQVAPTLAVLLKAFDYDTELLIKWLDEGEERLKDKHYQALEQFKKEGRKQIEEQSKLLKINLINELREIKKDHSNEEIE